ncbi:phage terminase small subunit P27 family [Romboutsia weinsteinii]|uniref:Phage terminase small subunit P27 family n=1 Tax=Romboutsia weinsteinii TaxID=2020949 RepID=A0A371J2A0_9FIRM|nr:P27 family phage terminase small subunit [Romboutsia weinsteinii]RDY26797.1 phage terminase small subunit P27 family [Romboutsia weinsteinii]
MAKASVPVELQRKHLTKEEKERRLETEKRLRGNNDKLKPPTYMTKEAKKIFKFLVKEAEEAQTFGNVDRFVLEQFSNTYANYKELGQLFNEELDFQKRTKIGRLMKQFSDALPRLYNELGLTPSTRAKFVALNLQKQEEENDPLLQLLKKREGRLKSKCCKG